MGRNGRKKLNGRRKVEERIGKEDGEGGMGEGMKILERKGGREREV